MCIDTAVQSTKISTKLKKIVLPHFSIIVGLFWPLEYSKQTANGPAISLAIDTAAISMH